MAEKSMPDDDSTSASGLRSLTADEFHPLESIGGIRGLVESMAPGLVFVVVFIVWSNLTPALIASLSVAVLAVVLRLVQRTPVTQAFGGVLGVVIGVIWAWRTGRPEDYFLVGLYTNVAYLAAILLSIAIRWPIVGVVVEGLRAGFTDAQRIQDGGLKGWSRWRKDKATMRRYDIATWLWVGLFGIRLAVQVPLYLAGAVGALGTARLAMGIPLWALALWLTWVLVKPKPGEQLDDAELEDTEPGDTEPAA